MLRAAIFLAFVALASAAPHSPLFFLNGLDLNDFPHQDGCKYNLSVANNFKSDAVNGMWYYDSVTSVNKPSLTCLRQTGTFTPQHDNVGIWKYELEVDRSSSKLLIDCAGPNYADAPADFSSKCHPVGHPTSIRRVQTRIAATDDGCTYALMSICAETMPNRWVELMGMLTQNKAGLAPADRTRLTKQLTDAGWDPKLIHRVDNSGCS